MVDLTPEIILDNKYVLLSKLGSGGTAEVLLGESKSSQEKVAIKILKDNSLAKMFQQEIEMLKKIYHPCIINIKDGGKGVIVKQGICSEERSYIVLELAHNGELFDYVAPMKCGFGESFGRILFARILEGIQACHEAGVVHRDLKMENIMLDDKWNVRIADFGFATLLQGKKNDGILTTPLGTLSYAAPEILRKQPYSGIPADVFSLGALLFTLVTARLGFGRAIKTDNFYKHICKKDYQNYWKVLFVNNKMNFSNEFKELYTQMIALDPNERPSISDILKSPWMSGPMPTADEMIGEFEKRASLRHGNSIEVAPETETRNGHPTVYRSFDNKYFSKLMKCSKYNQSYSNRTKISLKGINPYTFMNHLGDFLDTKAKGTKSIEPNPTKAEFDIIYQPDPIEDIEVDIEALEIRLKLKCLNEASKTYVLELIKKAGDKMEFYEVYDELIAFTQKL